MRKVFFMALFVLCLGMQGFSTPNDDVIVDGQFTKCEQFSIITMEDMIEQGESIAFTTCIGNVAYALCEGYAVNYLQCAGM